MGAMSNMELFLVLMVIIICLTIFTCFVFPGLIIRIHLQKDWIEISYFGLKTEKILLSNIQSVQVGSLFEPMKLFNGKADRLLTVRVLTSWTWRFVVIKMKPGSGMIKNWVLYVRNSEELKQTITSLLSHIASSH
jgi:hypothetical protein